MQNRVALIKTLEGLSLLDGKYEKITCINCDRTTGQQLRGAFSVVFRAYDRVANKWVALKFFDPACSPFEAYRLDAFKREPELLKTLLNKRRCLQLASELSLFNLSATDNKTGAPITLTCCYFALDWLDEKTEHYFEQQDQYSAAEKLRLFRGIVLAVAALHGHEIAHRDVKPDNLRQYREKIKRLIVLIDLGCAARCDSTHISNNYNNPVGFLLYAAPETYCGLSGDRDIAYFTDTYALGCLLFELFNIDYFYNVQHQNREFLLAKAACTAHCQMQNAARDRLQAWENLVTQLKHGITIPSINGPGGCVPPGTVTVLDDLLRLLAAFDFRDRPRNWDAVCRRIDAALAILQNHELHQRQAQRRLARKAQREKKARRHRERLLEHLKKSNHLLAKC